MQTVMEGDASVWRYFRLVKRLSHLPWLFACPAMPQRFSQDLHVIYRSHETFWGIAPATCRSRKSCHPAGSLPTPNLSRHRRRLRMVPLEKKDGGTPHQGSCVGGKSWCSPSLPHWLQTSELLPSSTVHTNEEFWPRTLPTSAPSCSLRSNCDAALEKKTQKSWCLKRRKNFSWM